MTEWERDSAFRLLVEAVAEEDAFAVDGLPPLTAVVQEGGVVFVAEGEG
jgi:hypothetical protein